MVSLMDVEPKEGQFCDMSRPKVTPSADSELAKKAFKLNIKSSFFSSSVEDAYSVVAASQNVRKQFSQQQSGEVRSPLSPGSGKFASFSFNSICKLHFSVSFVSLLVRSGDGRARGVVSHQSSVTSAHQVEAVEDRKALRDALYQGIFHRHRRTIFAVGSFLRMLKTRNSQYNTIRSSSEGEGDGEDDCR